MLRVLNFHRKMFDVAHMIYIQFCIEFLREKKLSPTHGHFHFGKFIRMRYIRHIQFKCVCLYLCVCVCMICEVGLV